ncbi:cathepsin B [Manduca sexta]|uniref:cathepsin B n=1 Tax=Manduca sexta TaxID=7130 RepID=UPI00188EB04A|nr:cathepsin B [Manduca sexta]
MLRVLLLAALAQFSACTFDPELNRMHLLLPKDQFIEYFNSQNYSWKIIDYPYLEGRNLTGTEITKGPIPGVKQLYYDPEQFKDLPENFDAREKWPNCETIKEVYDQGDCGSCWAFGTATVASDRTCIHKDLHVRLSVQDFNCFLGGICNGGIPLGAYLFWIIDGLVTEECKPYNITESKRGICVKECKDPSINYLNDKHKGKDVFLIGDNDDKIKAELVNNGPIQAGFTVYSDIKDYSSGIYEHKYGEKKGGHSVRVIGYGVENGIDYWLVANSWGTQWGEQGTIKIKRHQPELCFECALLTGVPA